MFNPASPIKSLTRDGRIILEENMCSVIHEDNLVENSLICLKDDILDCCQMVCEQILRHRYFKEFFYAILRIMDRCSEEYFPRSGHATFIFGSLINSEPGCATILLLLKDPKRAEETARCIVNVAQLITMGDIESMITASGVASLLLQNEDYRDWAIKQPEIDELITVLGDFMPDGDMTLCHNSLRAIAKLCISQEGRAKLWNDKDVEYIIINLIRCVLEKDDITAMHAAYILACLCEDQEGMREIANMRDILDLQLGLINMLKNSSSNVRKNAVFCLMKMTKWSEGQNGINDDPDIVQLLDIFCNLMKSGDEDHGKMSAVTLMQLSEQRPGYMKQKDESVCKATCMDIMKSSYPASPVYKRDVAATLKALMIPRPPAPEVKVLDAFTIEVTWSQVEAKSGCQVWYKLFKEGGKDEIYKGTSLSHTERNLKELTSYRFVVQAFTDDNEESFPSEVTSNTTNKARSSPPRNLRADRVKPGNIKIVWEVPRKLMGELKGYHVQEVETGIHYEPVNKFHYASNLRSNKEYTFKVCAITQNGTGEMATLTVKTLREDNSSPSKPCITSRGRDKMDITWDAPKRAGSKTIQYEVYCNDAVIYSGTNKQCCAAKLAPATVYKVVVVAVTTEGRSDSEPATKKTPGVKKLKKKPAPKPVAVSQADDGDHTDGDVAEHETHEREDEHASEGVDHTPRDEDERHGGRSETGSDAGEQHHDDVVDESSHDVISDNEDYDYGR